MESRLPVHQNQPANVLAPGRRLNRFLNAVLIGTDITQARRRVRWAWFAGFFWATIGLLNALLLFSGLDSEVENLWSRVQSAWVVAESVLVAWLSYGVLKRVRVAAVSLFFYFWISRIPLLALGWISLAEPQDVVRFIVMQVLFAYLFLQGMRGVLTLHFLTHPKYPAEASPAEESAA